MSGIAQFTEVDGREKEREREKAEVKAKKMPRTGLNRKIGIRKMLRNVTNAQHVILYSVIYQCKHRKLLV